jgi:hypothetical protein
VIARDVGRIGDHPVDGAGLEGAHDLDAIAVQDGVEVGGAGCEGACHGEVSLLFQPLDCDMQKRNRPA